MLKVILKISVLYSIKSLKDNAYLVEYLKNKISCDI